MIPELGVELEMPSHYYRAHDICYLNAYVHNPGSPIPDTPLVVMLDINTGDYWFWPSWVHYPPDVDWQEITVEHGTRKYVIIEQFIWPDDVEGSMDGIKFWGALLNEQRTAILGKLDVWEFGYGP